MDFDALLTTLVGGLFSLAGVWLAWFLAMRGKTPPAEAEVSLGIPSTVSFAAIRADEDAQFFREESTARLYPFDEPCAAYFGIEKLVDRADVAFDVTLLNSTGRPVVVSEIGFRIAAVAEVEILPMGGARSFSIERETAYVIDVPDLFAGLRSRLGLQVTQRLLATLQARGLGAWRTLRLRRLAGRLHHGADNYQFISQLRARLGARFSASAGLETDELLSLCATRLPVDSVVAGKLPEPRYLEDGAPFRFSLTLRSFAEHMPNCSVINLYAKTDLGEGFSEPLYVSFAAVRGARRAPSRRERTGERVEGARLVAPVEELRAVSEEIAAELAPVLEQRAGELVLTGSLDRVRAMLDAMDAPRKVQAVKQLSSLGYHLETQLASRAASRELMAMLEAVAKDLAAPDGAAAPKR